MSPKDGRPIYYVPHHVVIRPERETTKSRIVFDASARIENDFLLNNCVETGLALPLELVSILTRIMAFIRKIYLQVKLKKEDRDVFRYLWATWTLVFHRESCEWGLNFKSKSMSHSGYSDHKISRRRELKGNSLKLHG